MTAMNKTPILFAALLTIAAPAFAGDWWTTPEGPPFGTDAVCTLYNENLECVDAKRNFLASYTGATGASQIRARRT